MYQIHFKLLAGDGKPVDTGQQQMLDTVDLPYWSRGDLSEHYCEHDFRGPDIGDFVYHCHILDQKMAE